MATKVRRPSVDNGEPSFDVRVESVIGTVKYTFDSDDTPGLAAFRLIDDHGIASGEGGTFRFRLPDAGPEVTVNVAHTS